MNTVYPLGSVISKVTVHHSFLPFSSAIFTGLAVLLILILLAQLLKKLFMIYDMLREEYVFLELIPPARTEMSAFATQQVFSVIHSLGRQKTFIERIIGRKSRFSFEIVSTKEKGIRYIVRVRKQEASNITKTFIAYVPYVTVKTNEDYVPHKTNVIRFPLLNLR